MAASSAIDRQDGGGVKRAVQEKFGEAAASYATSPVHVGGPDLDAMVLAAELGGAGGPPPRVLDVGTGAGHTAFAFAPHAAHVEALDLTQEMLDEVGKGARARGLENIHCQLGDAEALPYPDQHFDVVTSRLCAHHFPHPDEFTREAARVLRPGGVFLLVDSVSPGAPALDTFFNAFELLRDPSHVRNHSRADWRRMFDGAGLSCEVLGAFMLLQEFSAWVERIGTTPTAVAHLRTMFDAADADARAAFDISWPGSGGAEAAIGIPCALLRGRRGDA